MSLGQDHILKRLLKRVLCTVRDLSPPGDLVQTEKYGFEFNDVEMQYDSYRGLQVRLRHGLSHPFQPFCHAGFANT